MPLIRVLSFPTIALLFGGCAGFDDYFPDTWGALTPGHNPSSITEVQSPGDEIFERQRMVNVQLQLPHEDWRQLQFEAPSIVDLFHDTLDSFEPFQYTSFTAQLSIDGVSYPNIGLQKAGIRGNLTSRTPQLVIRFDENLSGHQVLGTGLHSLSLKNSGVQDPSMLRECQALDLLSEANYPAPRCNFARVTVNGELLGYYANVEVTDERVLARHFDDATGHLYDGQIVDFFDNTLPYIQDISRHFTDPRTALHSLLLSLESELSIEASQLGRVLDLPAFRKFWALETLLGQADGYTNFSSNYYVYLDPSSDKLVFLPGGLQLAFTGERRFGPPYELTVYSVGRIANVLYADPQERARFRALLAYLNNDLWDADVLVGQAQDLMELVPGNAEARQAHLQYLSSHGDQLRQALREPAPEVAASVPFQAALGDECSGLLTPISGRFAAPRSADIYGTDAAAGEAILDASPDGVSFTEAALSFAGPDSEAGNRPAIYLASQTPGKTQTGVALILPRGSSFEPGVYPISTFETFAPAFVMVPSDVSTISTFGFVVDGQITIEESGPELGDLVVGRFVGTLSQTGCSQAVPEDLLSN